MKIAFVCGMSDDKAKDKIAPIANLSEVEQIFLLRRKPLSMDKVISYSAPKLILKSLLFSEIYRVISLFMICLFKKPDYLISIYFVPHGIYTAIAGKIFRKPVIHILIGTDRPKIQNSKILLQLFGNAAYVGVRGHTSKESLISSGISASKIFIPKSVNAIDYEMFSPKEIEKEFDLIYVGRIDVNKQVNRLIMAVSNLLPHFSELKVLIVGDGVERKKLEQLSHQLQLEDVITFTGNCTQAEVANYLQRSRIFMMASDFEGLPVAMIEALCCGLPVVVPDVGDIADIAEDNVNGILIQQPTEEKYYDAIFLLLNDTDYYEKLKNGAIETRKKIMVENSFEDAQEIWREVLVTNDMITKKPDTIRYQ